MTTSVDISSDPCFVLPSNSISLPPPTPFYTHVDFPMALENPLLSHVGNQSPSLLPAAPACVLDTMQPHPLLACEQAFLQRIATLREMVELPIVADGILLEEDARRVFGALPAVVDTSTGVVERLQKGEPLACVLGWVTPLLYSYAKYAEKYHNYSQPLLSGHDKIDTWLTAKTSYRHVKDLLLALGSPLARVAAWRFFALSDVPATPEGDLKRELFIKAADEHIQSLSDKFISAANERKGRELTDMLPRGLLTAKGDMLDAPSSRLWLSGDLVKEYTRGKHVRSFYLFSDYLLHFKLTPKGPAQRGLRASRNVLPLSSVRAVVVDEARNGFRIQREGKRDLVLLCDTSEERDHWVQSLRGVLGRRDEADIPVGTRHPTVLVRSDSSSQSEAEQASAADDTEMERDSPCTSVLSPHT
eukprot:TRINITY_DN15455_c0_g1_i1.p1 TRINITY_DN15455_c0_g1~~TRINITY_DN15455_c0_g1_i1.p1  ORF type:complete len:417 (+),score=42.45 TRINITY_DN15455_c0_g1_i1:42-1292(+)